MTLRDASTFDLSKGATVADPPSLWDLAYDKLCENSRDQDSLALFEERMARHWARHTGRRDSWRPSVDVHPEGESDIKFSDGPEKENRRRRLLEWWTSDHGVEIGDSGGDAEASKRSQASKRMAAILRGMASKASQRGATIAWLAFCFAAEVRIPSRTWT